jgi:ParB-like chromosome segregation protein Spo0J
VSKRKSVGLGNLSFNRIDPYGAGETTAPTPLAESSYFHVDMIMPDPGQPRRLLPETISKKLQRGQISASQALQEWTQLVETGQTSPAIKKAWQDVVKLADSIARQGLINPITIRPASPEQVAAGINYLIVTGERRWWAHVLLTTQDRPIREGHEEVAPDRIKASLAPEGTPIRAHQMIENLIREDISLIEKANGIYALRDELEKLSTEQKVTWHDVESLLGISRTYRTRLLKVLALSYDAQALIEENNLTERTVRPITEKLAAHPDLQLEALQALISWQQASDEEPGVSEALLPKLERLVEQLLNHQKSSSKTVTGHIVTRPTSLQRLHAKVQQTLRFTNRLRPAELQTLSQSLREQDNYADIAEDLRALRSILDTLLTD